MIKHVKKRNGSIVDFNKEKIQTAINKAFQEVRNTDCLDENVLDTILRRIKFQSSEVEDISVERIQDIVEQVLMEKGYYNVAKAYIRYRYKHELERQKHNDQELLDMVKGDNDYWNTENSNKNVKWVTTQRDYMAGIVSTDLARKYIFPKDVVEAHDAGIVHQHDMDYMAQATLHNCELINLNDMLQNGTAINKVKINKPHRLLTAMTITTQIMAAVAANSYGGESINLAHIAPFVRSSYNIFLKKYIDAGLDEDTAHKLAKQDLDKEVTDSVQTFNYQISTLFTLNGQAPFCSVFMYLNDTEEYKEELVLLIKEFFRQRISGMPNRDGIPVTQAFPKLLYVLEEDNYKPGTKYWDVTKLAIKCSSYRLTPDYISEKVMKQLKINGNGDGDCYACIN